MRVVFVLIYFVAGLQLHAQDFYTKEIIRTSIFDSTEVTALKYVLKIVEKSAFQKLWKKEMLKYSDGDYETNEFQTIMTEVLLPSVSKESFSTYISAKPTVGGLELILALKDSVQFIDLNVSPYKKEIESYFEGFILTTYLNTLSDNLIAETENLNSIDNGIKKNYKEIAKNEKLILKLESEIENAKKQIEIHDSQYDVLLKTIETRKTQLAGLSKGSENYKSAKKEVKNLEKNKKNMESDHVNNKNIIYDDEAKILVTKEAIATLEASIANLEQKKITQKQVILDLEEEIYSFSKP